MGLGAEVIRTPEVLLEFGNTFINLASSHSGEVSGGSSMSFVNLRVWGLTLAVERKVRNESHCLILGCLRDGQLLSSCERWTTVRTVQLPFDLLRRGLTFAQCCFLGTGPTWLLQVVNFRVCSCHLAGQDWQPDPGQRTSSDDHVRGADCPEVQGSWTQPASKTTYLSQAHR